MSYFLILSALFVLVYIYVLRSKEVTPGVFFFRGKNTNWVMMGLSFFATWWVSSFLLLADAMSFLLFGISSLVMVLLYLHQSRIVNILKESATLGNYFERRYNRKCGILVSTLNLIANVIFRLTLVLMIGSSLLNRILSGTDSVSIMIMLFVIVAIYIIMGGLKAEMYAQCIQSVTLFAFLILGALWAVITKSGPLIMKSFNFDMYSTLGMNSAAVAIGLPIFAFWVWNADETNVQKIISASSTKVLRRAFSFSFLLLLIVIILISLVFLGTKTADKEYFELEGLFNSSLLRGLFLIATVIGIMGAIASIFNNASLLVAFDFFKIFNRTASERTLILIGRATIGFLFLYIILFLSHIELFDVSLYSFLLTMFFQLGALIGGTFLVTLLWQFIEPATILTTLWCGIALIVGRAILVLSFKEELLSKVGFLNGMEYAVLIFVVTLLVSFTDRAVRKLIETKRVKS